MMPILVSVYTNFICLLLINVTCVCCDLFSVVFFISLMWDTHFFSIPGAIFKMT